METREYYDVRAPEVPSGVLDLSFWSEVMGNKLITMANRHLAQVAPGTPELRRGPFGYARIPEPENGPTTIWSRAVIETQRTLEIAVGRAVPMMVTVERVYRINFKAFSKDDWRLLQILFSRLPGWKGVKPYPHWYNLKDGPPPRLWGKIAPVGLRITGEVSQGQWQGWDTWLRRNMIELPMQR